MVFHQREYCSTKSMKSMANRPLLLSAKCSQRFCILFEKKTCYDFRLINIYISICTQVSIHKNICILIYLLASWYFLVKKRNNIARFVINLLLCGFVFLLQNAHLLRVCLNDICPRMLYVWYTGCAANKTLISILNFSETKIGRIMR